MDLPPLPTTITTTANHHKGPLNYSDSGESSSPLSRDAWDYALPQVPGGAKLRLMCSYGGHIIPRPHDKSLCYVGGETRIVVVDRQSSLAELSSRLSATLLHGRPFTLKYQLPSEDLDSLISVSTDEDLDNMVEEYDRSASSSPSRLRLFLFFLKPETTTSMGSLLDDAKSETWFVDALNSTVLLSRGLSDSAMDNLLNLDDESTKLKDSEAQCEKNEINQPTVVPNSTMPDSPAVENSSSSGSFSSSSPSNLPAKVGIDEQFAQLNLSSAHPPPTTDQSNRGVSDEERSDQGVPVGFRKPPLPLLPPQHNRTTGFSLPSPDSVTSDCSIASSNSFSKPVLYQDYKAPVSPNTNSNVIDPSSQIQTQHQAPQDPNLMIHQHQNHNQNQNQLQQQQFVHYISHTGGAGAVPVSSYYPIYAPPPQQQQQQQYPVYVMPMSHTQSYNMSMQPDHQTNPPTPGPATHPPIYPTKAPPTNIMVQPEMTGAGVYKTAVASNQFQQQFVGYAPSQSIAPGNANYGFDQVYYAQPQHPQYQTMTPATMAALTDAANQMPANSTQ